MDEKYYDDLGDLTCEITSGAININNNYERLRIYDEFDNTENVEEIKKNFLKELDNLIETATDIKKFLK